MRSRIAVALIATMLASFLIAPGRAQSYPQQYVTTVWQTEQGLPQNSANAILQDHLGYLWIGTFGGLARFDGERLRVFDPANTPGFGDAQIISLYESRSGVLWIGTVTGGLIRLDRGVATSYTERDGLPSRFVSSIRGDAQGNLWINTSGGVARLVGAKFEAYPTYKGKAIREFFLQAQDGSMWFRSGGKQVVRFGADGSIATLNVLQPSVFLVHEARDGSVWIAVRDKYRLVHYSQGVFSDVPLPPLGRRITTAPEFSLYAITMTKDPNGDLLLLTPAGVVRIGDGRLKPPEPVSLPANGTALPKARSLLVDREGNLWVGLVGKGLVRLRPAPLTAYAKDEGLSDASFSTVFQDREGRIWLGGDLLYWFDGHRFHLLRGVANVRAIAQTRDGDLWFGQYGGLYRYRSGALSHFNIEGPLVRAIHQDREGTLWIGEAKEERAGGLYRFRDGKLEHVAGISDVNQILEDPDGGLWMAGIEKLFYMRGGKVRVYDQKQGLPEHSVDIMRDSDGTLWIASYGGGLARFRNGRFKAITTDAGLPNNMLYGMAEDGRGNLWVSSDQNIFRLSLKELNDFADGKIASISPVSYGIAEGMRSSECDGGSPGARKTSDGRIWIPTLRGVVAIDPAASNPVPPPVVLEDAWANRVKLGLDGGSSAAPGNNSFDFRFTALSFSAPEKVHFKYRLEPFEKDWVDAGTRRTAHYTNMAPGEYSFHVIAANNYGLWSEQGAHMRFMLQPHFYQTNWFYSMCAIGFLGLLWAAYQFRVRQLHHALKKLLDVIDTIPGYVWSAQPDGSLDFINRRWLEFSGLSPEQGLGWGWKEAVHPEDRPRFVEAWRAAIASGKAMEAEARVRRADGQYRWLLIRNVPLHDKRGKIVKWYGTSADIDDRKRVEQALQQSEAYLAEAQRLSHTGSWASDSTTAPLYWSDEMFRIFGFDGQKGLPTREQPLQRVHPDDVDKLLQAFNRAIYSKVDSEVEFRIMLPDGTIRHARGIGHPVLDSNGEFVQVVGTMVDISERKRAEEESERLRQLEADLSHINRVSMMGELAASIAHEVNQPISGVVSNGSACLRWLTRDVPDLGEAREAARRIVRDGKRAGEIISRIRGLTRKTAAPIEKLDLNETIAEVLALVGDEAKRKNVGLGTQFADDLSPVSGDRIQLQQVVLNLVMNAFEAMSSVSEHARKLVITTRNMHSDQVQVTVEDSGIGLDPNTIARIFDPFYTTKPGGMGMGLSICRSILQTHRGRLWATANDGLGTAFHFSVPVYQKEGSHAGAAGV
jgi:PAS domain S-box-containing protein